MEVAPPHKLFTLRQACSPLIQLFFGFASDIDQTNINRDIRDGNWLSRYVALETGLDPPPSWQMPS